MESSNQFHESFRQGLTVGYAFTTTFVIVFYIFYCLPTQIVKKRKSKRSGCMKPTQKRVLPHQELKQNTQKKRKKARRRYIEREVPMELLEKIIPVNEIGWLSSRMSFTELSDATKYFSEDNGIGVGMSGRMYKATLPNGWLLAVKRFYDSDQLFIKRFELEKMILGRYNHRNIVSLIGFCIEEERNERILVYEYASNGTLSDWLNNTTRLGWPAVIRIALGVARGLCFLHRSLHVVHLNISPKCILLENNFEPKIYNFGGAIFMNHDAGKNSGFKKDVYDFGILLFELIRGKVFVQTSDCLSNTKGPFSTYTYLTNQREDPFGFYDAMDKCLNEIEFEDEVSALLRVACDCVHPFPCQRPRMIEVYGRMSNIWERDGIVDPYCFDNVSATMSRDELE